VSQALPPALTCFLHGLLTLRRLVFENRIPCEKLRIITVLKTERQAFTFLLILGLLLPLVSGCDACVKIVYFHAAIN
jgi:hypothetical protein